MTAREQMQALIDGKSIIVPEEGWCPIKLNSAGHIVKCAGDNEELLELVDFNIKRKIYVEPKKEKKKKQVWQWRYKKEEDSDWFVCIRLMDEIESADYFSRDFDVQKHAGPWEVEE